MIGRRTLGRTGFEVSEISLGAWQIGGWGYGPVGEAEARATLRAYLDAGGNFIDTARAYGESERIIGGFLSPRERQEMFIASKSGKPEPAGVREDLETTLRLLRTDRVDLYYLHSPPEDAAAMDRLLGEYARLREEGKIRAIGASIKGPDVSQKTVDLCRRYILDGRVDALMLIYSIFRQRNAEVFGEAAGRGVGVVARTVLESGFLSGQYAPGHQFDLKDDHRRRWSDGRIERILREAAEVGARTVAAPYPSLAQVAVRFVLDEPRVASIAAGARTPAQIAGSAAAASLPPLPPGLRSELAARYGGRGEEFNTGG